ncbi:hypothetical protein M0R45_011823 [Rubus argutus]|uniref:WW domain-containing protein n=1 Tax=Rubus argutus TaxID=59490 RepID=A0AAW1YBF1_RUBAR
MANNPQSSAAQPPRPPAVDSLGPQSFGLPSSLHYRPMVPTQQGQHFISSASQQFQPQPVGQGQPLQYSQQMQPYPLRPSQPGHAQPSSQALPMPYYQPRPVNSVPSHSQQPAPPFNNQMPGMPYPSSYMYAPPSFVQPQNNVNSSSQFQPMSQEQAHAVPATGQPWMSSSNHQGAAVVTPQQQSSQQPSSTPFPDSAVNVPNLTQPSPSDWQEHMAADGRRYYFNRSTRQSSWEKPLELMTPLERADASTVWKEYTSADGKKYYYNKVTRESKWTIPEELKLAREQAQRELTQGTQSEMNLTSQPPTATSAAEHAGASSAGPSTSSAQPGTISSPVPVTPISAFSNPSPIAPSGSSVVPGVQSSIATGSVGVQPAVVSASPLPASNLGEYWSSFYLGHHQYKISK